MAQTYVTGHAAMEKALVAWVIAVTGLSVRWKDEKAGRPAKPYVTLLMLVGGVGPGIDGEVGVYNAATERIDTVTYGERRCTVQVEVYADPPVSASGATAYRHMLALQASLRAPAIKEMFNVAGLGFLQMPLAPQVGSNADEQLGERWEHRAIMDLEFSYTSAFVDKSDVDGGGTNWVETVDEPAITREN